MITCPECFKQVTRVSTYPGMIVREKGQVTYVHGEAAQNLVITDDAETTEWPAGNHTVIEPCGCVLTRSQVSWLSEQMIKVA